MPIPLGGDEIEVILQFHHELPVELEQALATPAHPDELFRRPPKRGGAW